MDCKVTSPVQFPDQVGKSEASTCRATVAPNELITEHMRIGDAEAEPVRAVLHDSQFRLARDSLQEILREIPSRANNYVGMALASLEVGECQRAIALLESALLSDPSSSEHPQILLALGVLLQASQQYQSSIFYLKQLRELKPNCYSTLLHLGIAYFETSDFECAICMFRNASLVSPKEAELHSWLARSYCAQYQYGEAEQACRDGITHAPRSAELHNNLGVLLMWQGRFDEALEQFELALSIEPKLGCALLSLVRCKKITESDRARVEALGKLAEAKIGEKNKDSAIYFAVAKCYEDLGEYDKAFHNYAIGNSIERASVMFDRSAHKCMIDETIQHYSSSFFVNNQSRAIAQSSTPILVVGMPRSGTTLIEQILSAHSQVAGAEETHFWAHKPLSAMAFALSNPQSQLPGKLANEYLAHLRSRAGSADYLVDKLPQNFLFLGAIVRCLPSVRIIHVRRNPLDTCLSIFFQKFSKGHSYSNDLEDIAFYYEQYQRLMKHWGLVLPTPILHVDYEDLVTHFDVSVRRMLNHCNLDWQEQCLQFSKAKRVVSTASTWQVRQALHRQSVGRWENYRKHLSALTHLQNKYGK